MMAAILIIGFGAAFYALYSPGNVAIERDKITAAALAQAKDALIDWAVSRGDIVGNNRPGELPCPDTNNDGIEEGSCVAGRLGRVPWKTLGIAEPKDGYGETLWYAVAGPFRTYNSNSNAITSDTMGNLTVYTGSTAATLTTQAIAVIFAPGAVVGPQQRGTASAACSTTGTNIASNLCAANYIESTGGANNAVTSGPFISAPASPTFNDRVLAITAADLMPLVEQRVAREMMSILEKYRIATGVYPWADRSDGSSNDDFNTDAWNRNRFPCGDAKPAGFTGALALPAWLQNGCDCTQPGQRGWACVIYYTVAKNRLQNSGFGCAYSGTPCSTSTLTVTNASNRTADLCLTGAVPFKCTPTVVPSGSADLLLITPGAATVSRAAGWSSTTFGPISLYFEDAENSDNNDDTYVVPSSTTYDRDRMYLVR